MASLNLDRELITKAQSYARDIVEEIRIHIEQHTTVAVERTVLRLMGIDGVDQDGVPLPNVVVDKLLAAGVLGRGAAFWLAQAMQQHGLSAQEVAERVAAGKLDFTQTTPGQEETVRELAATLALQATGRIDQARLKRTQYLKDWGEGETPLLYVIVATGNIYEDVLQAQAAARQGADIIATIRTTGQSLLDYVPYGLTTEGFGGTYATQANFCMMRKALDEVSAEVGRYIRLTNYSSGLCMPEIAAMGALERLDVMLNDSMYGIIFRDINMKRTFVDQYFSRLINGYAGIIINTGEDNYLTTADAYEKAHTVLASQFINLEFAQLSAMPEELVGLGHAFEIDPGLEDSFLYELAQAQMVRTIFPKQPLKYMPPTKHMTGNIFKGQVQDALFNVASILSGQNIHLLGMLTEAIHTPFLQDRYLALENARYIFKAMRHLPEELAIIPGGRIEKRAQEVLKLAVDMLAEIKKIGLMESIGRGMFADISRKPESGRGLEGVLLKDKNYFNPFIPIMKRGKSDESV